LGCSSDLTLYYVQRFEPYLKDPVAFPMAQVHLLSYLKTHHLVYTFIQSASLIRLKRCFQFFFRHASVLCAVDVFNFGNAVSSHDIGLMTCNRCGIIDLFINSQKVLVVRVVIVIVASAAVT